MRRLSLLLTLLSLSAPATADRHLRATAAGSRLTVRAGTTVAGGHRDTSRIVLKKS